MENLVVNSWYQVKLWIWWGNHGETIGKYGKYMEKDGKLWINVEKLNMVNGTYGKYMNI